MSGESGFSFEDLQADLAGIAFQSNVRQGDHAKQLEELANGFTVNRVLPDHRGIPTGLNPSEFQQRFGDTQDSRFQRQINAMRKAIDELNRSDEK